MAQFVKSGKMRAIAVTAGTRLSEIAVPTLKEQGINVEIGNWRGVYGAPGITDVQKKALIDAVVAATKQKSWNDALAANDWFTALLTGDEFSKFVDADHKRIEESMRAVGLVK